MTTVRSNRLAGLIVHGYGLAVVTCSPVHAYNDEWRKVYRVDDATGASWLVRALRHDGDPIPAQLQSSAAILNFLERAGYAAPQVQPTVAGASITTDAGWSMLLLTFIQGIPSDYTPAGLWAIGASLATLHRLDIGTADAATLPNSRWMLDTLLPQSQTQLDAVATKVPHTLAPLHQA